MPLNTEVDYNNVVIKGTVELGVKGERGLQGFKGDQGIQGPPVPLAHELGDDPELAVSQKLLTDSIADMEQSNSNAVMEATHQAGLARDSAVTASEQATIATNKAGESAHSAQDASGSAQTSGQQATAATEQAGIATTKANEASRSASDAASSAGLAADSETAAEQAATIATNKADEASQSAQAAAQSATQAEETLDDKVDKADIAQATGSATDKVMSQKAVTDAIASSGALIDRERIADGAVDRAKLSGAFSAVSRSGLPTNDLNLLRDECTWFGSATELENKPDDLVSGSVLVEIKPHRDDSQFIVQRIYSYPNMDIWWERVLVTTIAPPPWRKRDHNKTYTPEESSILGSMIATNAISNRTLNYGHDYYGILPNNNLNHTLLKSGVYLVLARATNLPPDAKSSDGYLLEHSGGLGWAVQRLTNTSTPDKRWTRVARLGGDGQWREWSFDGPAAPPEPPPPAPNDRLAGKKIVFLGDSITAQGFPDRIAAALPNTEIINFGVGGTRMGRHPIEEWDSLSGYSIATAIATGDWTRVHAGAAIAGADSRQYIIDGMNAASVMDWSTVDYIVVGYGTNDFSGTPIGEQGSTDTGTYIGGTNVLINQILTANPRTRLLFWSPVWKGRTQSEPEGVYGGSDVAPNIDDVFLIEYVHALLEACRLQHVEAINLYDSSGIGPLTNETYLTDLVHPTAEGKQLLADKIMGALMSRF